MKRLVAAVLLFGCTVAPSKGAPAEKIEITQSAVYGCKSIDVIKRQDYLLGQDDGAAADALLKREAHQCYLLSKTLYIEERRDDAVCLRPKSNPDCYWIMQTTLDTMLSLEDRK